MLLLCFGGLAILLILAAFLRGQDFSPGQRIESESVEDISTSLQDTVYPPRDILLFQGRPDVVYVYLAVRDFDPEAGVEARVRRSGSGSPVARLFGFRGDLRVLDGEEEQLAPSEDGVSGVVKFEVRGGEGERLPAGNYVVDVRVDDELAASKRFVIQN